MKLLSPQTCSKETSPPAGTVEPAGGSGAT